MCTDFSEIYIAGLITSYVLCVNNIRGVDWKKIKKNPIWRPKASVHVIIQRSGTDNVSHSNSVGSIRITKNRMISDPGMRQDVQTKPHGGEKSDQVPESASTMQLFISLASSSSRLSSAAVLSFLVENLVFSTLFHKWKIEIIARGRYFGF